jgi:CubicO group peptidase (beta-lactamase class C family)
MGSPVGPLTVGIHLRTSAKGQAATLDVVQFGSRGGALTGASVMRDKLHFDDPDARAHYDATWDPAGRRWNGAWVGANGQAVPLILSPGLVPPLPRIEGLDGDWRGGLNMGSAGVQRLALHFRTGKAGTVATADSLDAGAFGLPAAVARDGRRVSIDIVIAANRFELELSEDGASMQGEFSQGQQVLPVVFTRAEDAPPAPRRGGETAAPAPLAGTFPSEAEIRKALVRRIDQERRGVGIVVGLVSPSGRKVIAYGSTEVGGGRPVDGDTLFEIGSVTKTFISLILQDMALRGEVSLDDPVANYFPGSLSLADRSGRPITLRELATHASGLPRDFFVGAKTSAQDAFSNATEADLYAFLAKYQPPGADAPAWSYSNIGVGMLGLALAHRAGTDLQTLMRLRVTGPLGMSSTTLGAPPSGARLAVGHDAELRPLPPVEVGPPEAAAGAIRSSANDMLAYLAAELGYRTTPLTSAMHAMLARDYGSGLPGLDQELGWMSFDVAGRRIFTHSGGTFGQRAFVAFDPKYRSGVVVLANAESVTGVDDIGEWLIGAGPLRALPPAPPPPKQLEARAAVQLGPDEAKAYVGDYRLTQHISLAVAYEAGQLRARTTAGKTTGPWLALTFHGQGVFSIPAANTSVAFQSDGGSGARGFILRNPAGEFQATRIPGP